MKKVVTVKTFFEWVFSDENSQGVSISEESIDHMNDFTFNYLKQLFLNINVLPYHCIHKWEEEELEGDFDTQDLELVKNVVSYQ